MARTLLKGSGGRRFVRMSVVVGAVMVFRDDLLSVAIKFRARPSLSGDQSNVLPRGRPWDPARYGGLITPIRLAEPALQSRFFETPKIDGVDEEKENRPDRDQLRAKKQGLADQDNQHRTDHWISNEAIRTDYH